MVDKKLSQFDEVGVGDVSYIPVLDGNTKNGKLAATKAMPFTNCVTEIPQDIKLTLSSGTLTLKAGSILTAPDGTQTTTAQDYTKTYTTNGQYAVFCAKSSGSIQNPELLSRIGSGSSLPADNTNYTVFYNTTDSKIYRYGSNGWANWAVCFPIAIITVSGGAISSIDQVFNGFGYIGSTIFALPGVKGLYPNGRNSDGTLKNTAFTTSNVIVYTNSYTTLNNVDIRLNETTLNTGNLVYDEYLNYNLVGGSSRNFAIVGKVSASDTVITEIKTKPVFHAVDYYDLDLLSHKVEENSSAISTNDSNALHKSGNESAGGTKTFTAVPVVSRSAYTGVYAQRSDIEYNVAPASNMAIGAFELRDKNGTWVGRFPVDMYANGTNVAYMQVRGENNTTSSISIKITASGDTYGECPTPPSATDSSTKIATTAWVAGHRCTTAATTTSTASVNAPAYIVQNYKNGKSWYRVWSDGWIEQGGYKASNGNVTLLKAMADTDYSLQVTADDTSCSSIDCSGKINSTSEIKLNIPGDSDGAWWRVSGY